MSYHLFAANYILLEFVNDGQYKSNPCISVYNDNEVKFGIDAYPSSQDGFMAVLKARFSDFCVHEVDMDGILAKLLSVSGLQKIMMFPIRAMLACQVVIITTKNLHGSVVIRYKAVIA